MEILKDRIIFSSEDFIRGLVDRWAANAIKKLGRGYANAENFDPINILEGFAFPGNLPVVATNSAAAVDAALLDAVLANGGIYAYLSSANEKLHRLDVTSNTVTNAGAWPHSITGSGVHAAHASFTLIQGSVEVYNVAGTPYLFYAWNDGTDWDVGTLNLNATFDDDFMSSVPATPLAAPDLADGKTKYHNLYASSQDDILYIPSGRYVHAYDGSVGANGTFYAKDMIVPPGFDVMGLGETGYDLVVFISNNVNSARRGKAYAYFYGADRPADPYKTIDLQDDEVAAPFNYGNSVGCFTRSRSNGRCALRLFNGSKFEAKFFWTGGLPTCGGVEVIDEAIKWNSDGLIFHWGPEGEIPVSGHQTNDLGNTSAFVKSFILGVIYSGGGTTTTGLMYIDSTKYMDTARVQSLMAYPLFPKGKIGKITEVQVHFARAAAGGRGVSVRLLTNARATNHTIISSIETITAAILMKKYLLNSSGGQLPSFKDLAVDLLWNAGSGNADAPGIEKVIVFFRSTVT